MPCAIDRTVEICVGGEPISGTNPLPIGGAGPGSNVLVTDIEDGTGNSVMDAANDAIRVNVVAGGSGGGAVTIADGADVAQGATADAAALTDTGTFSSISLFKRLLQKFTTQFPAALVGGRFDVNIGASSATVPVSAASLPLPTGASTEATLATRLSESDFDTKIGSLTEAAPGTDTASSGLNGRLQRIAQRLTSLIALLPAALVNGRLDVNVGSTTPVTGTLSSGSGTIVTPAVSQTVFAAPGSTRLWVEIVNVSDETLWVNWNGGAAVQDQPSYPLLGNGLGVLRFSARDDGFVPQTAINIIGATAAKAYSAYQVLA